jgi:hypothetical protein
MMDDTAFCIGMLRLLASQLFAIQCEAVARVLYGRGWDGLNSDERDKVEEAASARLRGVYGSVNPDTIAQLSSAAAKVSLGRPN